MPTKPTVSAETQRSSSTKVERAYTFFDESERTGRHFTLQDICASSGYTPNTAKIYISKKWYWFLQEDTQGLYYCDGLHQFPISHFVASHSQKWNPYMPVSKPRENAVLLLIFVLTAMLTFYKHRQKWRLRIWRIWLPIISIKVDLLLLVFIINP